MREVIDVLVIVTLALQMLTNTVILLGVLAFLYMVSRKQQPSAQIAPAPVLEQPKKAQNPCDHCQAELGDPSTSRVMEDATILVYTCPNCRLPSERKV